MNKNNGHDMNIDWDVLPLGMHKQVQNMDFSTGSKMRRSSGQSKVFDNNGSTNKGSAGGTINHNSEYSSVTYGY